MDQIRKFKDSSDWPEVRKSPAENAGLDEEAIAIVGEQEGDSLDLVETCMALGRSIWFEASELAQKLTLRGAINRMDRLPERRN